MTTGEILKKAKEASMSLLTAGEEQRNEALRDMADALLWDTDEILSENEKDMEKARGVIPDIMLDGQLLTSGRIQAMAETILEVEGQPDPLGKVLMETERPNGMCVRKCSVPIGVIAIIYGNRPLVTSSAAALCIKSGNTCVLRCADAAYGSVRAIVRALRNGLEKAQLSPDLICLIEDTSRESAMELMTANGYVDLLIPRGGADLIRVCTENATVSCLETGAGICHIYIDQAADFSKALRIIDNAKTSRPGAGNAADVCLVHSAAAGEFLPLLQKRLIDDRISSGATPVELRLDERAAEILMNGSEARDTGTDLRERLEAELMGQTDHFLVKAKPEDFDTEFLGYTLAVKIVDSLEEAIAQISAHSTGYADAIITQDGEAAEKFLRCVDSAAVYVNASTRLTEGEQFGLGCELGVSTQKLHARGPIGLEELTTYKYEIQGDGQIR